MRAPYGGGTVEMCWELLGCTHPFLAWHQGPGLPPLSPVSPNHWLQAWLAQGSEGHLAWAGELRLVLQWLLDTRATIMGNGSGSSAWCEKTLPQEPPHSEQLGVVSLLHTLSFLCLELILGIKKHLSWGWSPVGRTRRQSLLKERVGLPGYKS